MVPGKQSVLNVLNLGVLYAVPPEFLITPTLLELLAASIREIRPIELDYIHETILKLA
jgi:hypothetical protein